jgi:hypothetical protein
MPPAGSPAGCRSAERAHTQHERHHYAVFIHASFQSKILRHFRMVGPPVQPDRFRAGGAAGGTAGGTAAQELPRHGTVTS